MSIAQKIKGYLYRSRRFGRIYFKFRGSLSFSKNSLDLKLSKYLTCKKETYVEIGANDGIEQSNSKYFEVFKGWSGVLIEPSPENFKALQRNRSKRNFFANCACVPFSYEKPFIELMYSDLMTTPLGLENDLQSIEDHILESQRHLKRGEVHIFRAQARTMTDVLKESNFKKSFDFLSLDVEGAELSVLQGIDHDEYRFRYILVECRDIKRMETYLENVDYVLRDVFSEHDYLFENVR
jgi:FkbM family methyltransferase